MIKRFQLSLIVAMSIFFACKKDDGGTTKSSTTPTPQTANFNVSTHSDAGFESMPKKVVVFGIPIYGAAGVEDSKMVHAANIMAQYLDNDEDGVIDNQTVVDQMLIVKSFLVMWKTENDLNQLTFSDYGQDLGNDETRPEWHTNGHTGQFDATLEEVLHLITHTGYAQVYPDVFGEVKGSEIALAMDKARGGQFDDIPASYPSGAWYTYDDNTCDYSCQVTEYTYWALTSILGAQAERLSEIEHEWKLNTKDLVSQTDGDVHSILTNSTYKLATQLPDGTYRK